MPPLPHGHAGEDCSPALFRLIRYRQLPRSSFCHSYAFVSRRIVLAQSLTFEEREQVGVDDVGLRRDHAVRQIFVQAISRRSSDGKPALRRAITGGTAEKGI